MTTYKSVKYNISGADLTGLTASQIPNLDTAKVTTGTFADARISASSVTAHASDYITWQSVVTASTLTAVAGRGYPINTTSNACTVTLPASASVGDTIKFVDYARNWGTNALTLNQNSLNFQGFTSPNPIYNTVAQAVTLTYVDATKGWLPTVDDDVTNEVIQPITVDFLAIAGAGGGGGGYAGGGGAGGYRNSFSTEASGGGGSSETSLALTIGQAYTITIGAGGTYGTISTAYGTNGINSSISGVGITTITSVGGGGGSSYNYAPLAGGSGGGQGGNNTPSAGAGTANQGYAGGTSSTLSAGGGGGSAGEVGYNASGTAVAGAGGNGLASAITGSSITRAGGGGGGTYNDVQGAGGSGGGGTGGKVSPNVNGTAGTANTGSGGGASGNTFGGAGAAGTGGSGVIILSMLDADYTGTTTGSPTVATGVSGQTILTFTGSGSYTA